MEIQKSVKNSVYLKLTKAVKWQFGKEPLGEVERSLISAPVVLLRLV